MCLYLSRAVCRPGSDRNGSNELRLGMRVWAPILNGLVSDWLLTYDSTKRTLSPIPPDQLFQCIYADDERVKFTILVLGCYVPLG